MPPPPPSPKRNPSLQTPTTSGNGTVPTTISIIVHASTIYNTFVAPFTYGMPGFDTSLILTYSTLQTTGLGVGSSTNLLQGSLRVPLLPTMQSLTVGVIFPLCPHRLEVLFNNHPDSMLVLACLAEGVKGLSTIRIWLGPCCSLYLVISRITPHRQYFHQEQPLSQSTQHYANICTFTWNDGRNHFLSRFWKSREGYYTYASNIDRGKPLPHPVEPRARFSSYTRGID
jgi:hypothetical protein